MKISNSKKQLAKIIHENRGWREGTTFAAQDRFNMAVDFYECTPIRDKGDDFWYLPGRTGVFDKVQARVLIRNWHQSILSREEYFHLYPAPDADGWIDCNGCEPGIDRDAEVDVKFRDGEICHGSNPVRAWCWIHGGEDDDIIAYRLHKTEQVKSTAVGDDETNLAAKEELDAMEYKPSIEQLAADYRNRKDYADRKREEADAAKADAEAKLAELVAAGKAMNLVISVAEEEPELVITDWRDLRFGDEIEYLEGHLDYMIGEVGAVCEFDEFHKHSPVRIESRRLKGAHQAWPRKWRFIRRP